MIAFCTCSVSKKFIAAKSPLRCLSPRTAASIVVCAFISAKTSVPHSLISLAVFWFFPFPANTSRKEVAHSGAIRRTSSASRAGVCVSSRLGFDRFPIRNASVNATARSEMSAKMPAFKNRLSPLAVWIARNARFPTVPGPNLMSSLSQFRAKYRRWPVIRELSAKPMLSRSARSLVSR